MTSGLDTTFLVQVEIIEHPGHSSARTLLEGLLARQEPLALAPQVLSEFVHVVTDARRFTRPMSMGDALRRAQEWWNGLEIVHALPTRLSTEMFLNWMAEHGLGRKRVLDTQLAATYHCAGVERLVTTNARDFTIFGCFELLIP